MLRYYVESINEVTVTNNMNSRTYACIALGTSVNLQGSQKVFDIYTRRILKRGTIKDFPIPDRISRCMKDLVKKSKKKEYG